ncbi:hypothetical protein LGM65_19375 [Burkholderia anthina]|uniref:hypothetical protein n=1 Tax=Burkholderia anthina TaxID=179879 RepID=UPI001CF146F8|nr:hypothetical protein [Burkholderia anthina]MCA8093018.1 hypothetical protein [Burkholderia anthina]
MTSTQKIFEATRRTWHRAKGGAVEQGADGCDRHVWIAAADIGGTTAFFAAEPHRAAFTGAARMSSAVSRATGCDPPRSPAVHEVPAICHTDAPRRRCFHFSFCFVSPEIRFATFTFLDHTVLHGQTK